MRFVAMSRVPLVDEKAPRWGSEPRGIKLRRWGRNLTELEEQVIVDSR
jgi:hypothetical protein